MRKCESCGAVMPAQQGRGRPRKVCEACRPTRSAARVVQLGGGAEVEIREPARKRDEPALVAAVRARLVDADRADSIDGLVALELAGRIVDKVTTGSAVAALTRELDAAMARAMVGVKVAEDPVDRFKERRDRAAAGQ